MDGLVRADDIGVDLAMRIIDAGITEAGRRDVALCFCVADRAGNPVGTARMNDAPVGAYTIACDKAFSAAVWLDRTGRMGEATLPGGEDWGIPGTFGGRMIVFAGGVPVFVGERHVGALGVSGALSSEDEQIALVALEACGLTG